AGRASQNFGDIIARFYQPVKVNSCLYAESVQHIEEVLAGDIPGSPRSVRTPAQSGYGTVNNGDAALQNGQDVGQSLPVGVVEMNRQLFTRDLVGNSIHHGLRLARSADP